MNWIHNVGRYEHKKFGVAFVNGSGTEELTQNRNISDARDFAQLRRRAAIQQASDAEGLPILQLDLCFCAPRGNCRHGESRKRECVVKVKSADFRRNMQAQRIVFLHDTREVQLHAERLELDGDRSVSLRWLNHGEGKFSTREEGRLLADDRHQVWFGQNFENVPRL